MKEILQRTLSLSRELDALQREHQAFIMNVATSEPEDYVSATASDPAQPEVLQKEEFKATFQEEKLHSINMSLNTLKRGAEEAQLMIMVANYISELEGDKLKLRAQVKRLCAENNWLRESLTESQQLLQDVEVSMGKLKVEKDHFEFLLGQQERPPPSPTTPVGSELHASEMTSNRNEGVPVTFPMGLPENLPHDLSNLDSNLDYEVPEKIRVIHQLALQHVNQGRPEVAIPLCRKAVQELEQKTGRNNPDLATLLNILAVIYREQGRFREAIRVLEETLEIRENVFGPAHAAVASTLNNLSVLHGKCGDFKTAEPFCQRALEIRQALLGPSHPDVAKQFCNLAVLSSNLGRYEDVEHCYLRALEIFQLELGPDDPNVTKTMNNLANCYLKQGKYKTAEAMFKKVLKTVHEDSPGQDPPRRTYRHQRSATMGEVPMTEKDPSHVEPGHWHKLTPVQSPTLNDTLRCLTDTYRGQGRLEDAAELELLSKEKILDKSHKDRLMQIFGTDSLPKESNNSLISTKTQSLQKNPSSKASLTWKWVVGQRASQHKYTGNSESTYSTTSKQATK